MPAGGNRNLIIGAIILAAVLVIVASAYLYTRRGSQTVLSDVTTDSGLRIQDLKIGDGPSPTPGQTVTVHYTGWLENGTQFETSRTGKPAQFKLGGNLIKGWNEGLATMKKGGLRKLIIPSNLAYGAAGSPPKIPANAKLTFEIELLDVK